MTIYIAKKYYFVKYAGCKEQIVRQEPINKLTINILSPKKQNSIFPHLLLFFQSKKKKTFASSATFT